MPQMRRRFIAYTLADPRDGTVFFAGYGRPTEPGVLVAQVRRRLVTNQSTVRPSVTATLRDARIADILGADAEPVVGVLVSTEVRAEAVRRATEAVQQLGLSVQGRERIRRPCPTVGEPLTTKAVALLLLSDPAEGPLYAALLVTRARERWGIDVVPRAAREALVGLETGGHVESHQRPNDTLIGRPRTWYVLTDRGRRAALRVRETVRGVVA
jgi:hypothetical protein